MDKLSNLTTSRPRISRGTRLTSVLARSLSTDTTTHHNNRIQWPIPHTPSGGTEVCRSGRGMNNRTAGRGTGQLWTERLTEMSSRRYK